jgi:GT2 family glycosyltransferase
MAFPGRCRIATRWYAGKVRMSRSPQPQSLIDSARPVVSASVGIVVLNWNNANDTIACLESLRVSAVPVTAIVVDNGSTDGSAEVIESSGLADVFLRTGANLGYAGGNNAGLRLALDAGHATVMVLNNDTIVHPTMIERLLRALSADTGFTVISPRIVYHDRPQENWFAGGVVDRGWPRHLRSEEVHPGETGLRSSDLLSGCCLIARAQTWRHIGLFDEKYFLIFEDSDWSMRARRRRARLLICDDAVLEHRVSRSFRAGAVNLLGTYYYTRNGLRFHLSWQRIHTLHFLTQRVARPLARAARDRTGRRAALFAVLGALGCLVGQTGPAAVPIQRLAARLTRNG